ncbi:hypothetical protein ATANTOWER_026749 [Ataeniobius toweri]|uniref:Uncharacterized protein n=1 Tax=Ataeniobius toweri TaxID=208326 RepID=A0ABU7CDL8_9TELE|nr:hypothetical protein [Ataeniobius toweri]
MNSNLNPISPAAPMNPNMNFPTGPPPTRTQISNTCRRTQVPLIPSPQGHTPPQMSSTPKKLMKRHPHSATSTHSPTQGTQPHAALHHTARRTDKATALRNATPASAHKRNQADATEHRNHNGSPTHTKTGQTHLPGSSR